MITSANFACKHWFANFACGGLNFQIEHHLFPKVCHVHYPAIRPIVMEAAKEFNLPYMEYETFTSAMMAHVRTLRSFGRDENYRGQWPADLEPDFLSGATKKWEAA